MKLLKRTLLALLLAAGASNAAQAKLRAFACEPEWGSLLRLQLSHDRPNGDDSDDAFTLQYQFNLGAHGAHKF